MHISSSLAGILNSLTPLFTLILGVIIFGYSTKWSKVLGVAIGLLGASVLVFKATNGSGGNSGFLYALLVILATMCYAISSNTVGKYLKMDNAMNISTISFVLIGIPALFYLMSTDFLTVLVQHEQGWSSLGAIALLALGSTVLASVIYFRLLLLTSPVFASMVAYLIPIVALIWGVFEGEHIGVFHILGMLLVLGGVYLSKN